MSSLTGDDLARPAKDLPLKVILYFQVFRFALVCPSVCPSVWKILILWQRWKSGGICVLWIHFPIFLIITHMLEWHRIWNCITRGNCTLLNIRGVMALWIRCLPFNLGIVGSNPTQVTTMILIWHQYWVVPGSGLESDKYKLLELVSQSN